MREYDRKPSSAPSPPSATRAPEASPGKHTLVAAVSAPAPGSPGEHAPAVQRRETGPASTDVHAAAAQGIASPATPMPHADRIQTLFGRHDVGSIQAHVGGDAAQSASAMGASAYATGNHVVFASSPDLHTAAHEAAHVVQQRGGVQLKGGVGQAGDAYEQHADAVADRVVQGQSAEALLDEHAASSPGGGGVQRKILNALGDPMLPGKLRLLIEKFKKSSYYLAIQRQRGVTAEQVDTALTMVEDTSGLDVRAVQDEVGGYSDETLQQIERAVVKALSLHQSVSSGLSELRNAELKRGGAATKVSDSLLRDIDILAQQSNEVAATLTKGKRVFPPRGEFTDPTSVSMDHKIEFHTDNANARYIRFVKSSRLMSGKISVTVPGYVTYSSGTAVDTSAPVRTLVGQTRAAMSTAAWSLDGPKKEFEGPAQDGKLTNVDTPGMLMSHPTNFPYVLITEFIGVLFDPTSSTVLNITKYKDELVEDGSTYPTQPAPSSKSLFDPKGGFGPKGGGGPKGGSRTLDDLPGKKPGGGSILV